MLLLEVSHPPPADPGRTFDGHPPPAEPGLIFDGHPPPAEPPEEPGLTSDGKPARGRKRRPHPLAEPSTDEPVAGRQPADLCPHFLAATHKDLAISGVSFNVRFWLE